MAELATDVQEVSEAQQSSDKMLDVSPVDLAQDVRLIALFVVIFLLSLFCTTHLAHSLSLLFQPPSYSLILHTNKLISFVVSLFLYLNEKLALLSNFLSPFLRIQVQLLQKQLHEVQMDKVLGSQHLTTPHTPYHSLLLR